MAGDSEPISQDEIEKLLADAQAAKGQEKPPALGEPAPTAGLDDVEAMLMETTPAVETPAAASPKPEPPSDDVALDQGEIERMLADADGSRSTAPAARLAAGRAEEETVAIDDIELLLNQAEDALASVDSPHAPGVSAAPFELKAFTGARPTTEGTTLDLIRDVELDIKIELGRTNMFLEDVLRLRKGTVVPLDKLAGDPVDIYVNGRLIARGEVLVLNDSFCVRIAELIVGESAVA